MSGSQGEFVIDENDQVKIFPLNVSVESLSGILYQPGIQPATLEEMDAAIFEGVDDWA